MYYSMYPDYFDRMAYMYREESVISLITEAIKDEMHDRVKYKRMMDMTQDEKVRRQIQFAYDDEGKHYKMFNRIYQQIAGKPIKMAQPPVEQYDTLLDAVESSIDGELGAVELYRKIYGMLTDRQMRNNLFEIITDEQEHATRFVYLYSMLK